MCGRLSESKLDFLFGSKARWVQSTALIPLGEKGAIGMMAIGSSDPARFYPGMGTLFLDLLANVISATLADDQAEVSTPLRLNPVYASSVMKQQQQFLDYLHHERGLSPRTRAAYQRDLTLFFEELSSLEID